MIDEAITQYRAAGGEEAACMRPLADLLTHLSEPARLRAVCRGLARTRRLIDYAYRHNNGFFVLYLEDPEPGLQIRLHIWTPAHPPRREHPHRHRMGFVSKVLTGTLHSTMFERLPERPGTDPAAGRYREIVVQGPAQGQFDVTHTSFAPAGIVRLRATAHLVHHRGESYQFPRAGIHCVATPVPLTAPVITLTIWEPALQPSIAYEPLEAPPVLGPLPVQRLSPDTYDHALSLVLDSQP